VWQAGQSRFNGAASIVPRAVKAIYGVPAVRHGGTPDTLKSQ